MATIDDIFHAAFAAADEFAAPIATASAQPSSPALDQKIRDMNDKQLEILKAARRRILDSPELDEALKALQTATSNLNRVAQIMVDATSIIKKANEFVGFGTAAVNAIKSVSVEL